MNKWLFNKIMKIKVFKSKILIIAVQHLVNKQKYNFNIRNKAKSNRNKIYNLNHNKMILKIHKQHKYKLI